ncbi:hypothetical protein ACKI14_44955 [Streptomyces turgidiscabies]|uniref:hypothetical protein n=1 Tax=Streptomyces turgidiscabies TaxID=85558 RepID=UPI0038F6FA74
MTVHMDPVGGVLLMVAYIVGHLVYKHTRTGPTSKGDVVGAIVCGTAVATVLLLVLSSGTPVAQTPVPPGDGTPSIPTSSAVPGP